MNVSVTPWHLTLESGSNMWNTSDSVCVISLVGHICKSVCIKKIKEKPVEASIVQGYKLMHITYTIGRQYRSRILHSTVQGVNQDTLSW